MTWRQCLLALLDQIETPLVLYLQENYFLHQSVRDDLIFRAAQYLLDHPELEHVALTHQCSYGAYDTHFEPCVGCAQQNARYRISIQSGLWCVETPHSYLDPEENGWMSEIFGTCRAQRPLEALLFASCDNQLGEPAIDYLHKGILKGIRLRKIANVVTQNGIDINLTSRSF